MCCRINSQVPGYSCSTGAIITNPKRASEAIKLMRHLVQRICFRLESVDAIGGMEPVFPILLVFQK